MAPMPAPLRHIEETGVGKFLDCLADRIGASQPASFPERCQRVQPLPMWTGCGMRPDESQLQTVLRSTPGLLKSSVTFFCIATV